jgi:DNA invertase Pin-like site-specific DNA recombinase
LGGGQTVDFTTELWPKAFHIRIGHKRLTLINERFSEDATAGAVSLVGPFRSRGLFQCLPGCRSDGVVRIGSVALIGYARVSTTLQDPGLQVDALQAAGCERIFTDHASGALDARPQLGCALDHLRDGDVLVVWRLDRLGRSLRHLIDTVRGLGERGVAFRSVSETIDTTTPGGRLLFHLLGSLAEFERDLISERTAAGLAAARARGRKGGRPSVMTPDRLRIARELYDGRRHTVQQIAAAIGVSRATVYRALTAEHPPSASRSQDAA